MRNLGEAGRGSVRKHPMPTLSERIISQHTNHPVSAGDIAIVDVDAVMATDATAPFALKAFKEMGGEKVWNKDKVFLIVDHASPAPNERVANLHKLMRDFEREQGIKFYDVGAGICHQLMVENEHVKPGDLFLGADSHTPTYGALGAFAVGVGSTDLAGVLRTGKTWLKVPQTVLFTLNGKLSKGVSAKDVILFLIQKTGVEGAVYEAIEFNGTAVESMTLASRMVLTNMVAEMGAKTGLVDTKLHEVYITETTADAHYFGKYVHRAFLYNYGNSRWDGSREVLFHGGILCRRYGTLAIIFSLESFSGYDGRIPSSIYPYFT